MLLRRRRSSVGMHPIANTQHNQHRNIFGPLPRYARAAEADEERPPAGAVQIARDPVAALLAAVRQVAPADGFGLQAERGGDAGGGKTVRAACGTPSNPCETPDTGRPPISFRSVRDASGRPPLRRAEGLRARASRGRGARTDLARDRRQKERPAPKCRPGGEGGNETMMTDR